MKKNNKNNNSGIEMGNLFKIVLVILIVFGAFYIFTYYLQKNKQMTNIENKPNTITTIQYDEILIGNLLNQKEDDYYVLIVNESDYNARYKEYLSRFSNKGKFYYSLIDNGLNKKYIVDSSNLKVDNIQDLKVSQTSLLKINNGKIVEAYDGNSSVMEALINIGK